MFARHAEEATARNLTFSRLLFEIVKAHQAGTRLEAPQARMVDAELKRDICRIGNNVNQIAKQSNEMKLHLIKRKAEMALDELTAAARRV